MTVVAVLGTFERAAENSEVVARHIEAAGHRVIRIHRDAPAAAQIRKMARADIVYATGFGFAWKLWAAARLMGKRTVNHWVGTDVLTALEQPRFRAMAQRAAGLIHSHLTVAPWLAEELRGLDIQAQLRPFITPAQFDPRAAPGRPGILTYLPDERADFYGAPIIRELARALPDIPFAVVAGTDQQPALPNVAYLGWVQDLRPLYERYPILARFAQHDGLPKMVLEALACGNQVVFKYPFPGCHRAQTTSEALTAIQSILAAGCPINVAGVEIAQRDYAYDRLVKELLQAIGVQ